MVTNLSPNQSRIIKCCPLWGDIGTTDIKFGKLEVNVPNGNLQYEAAKFATSLSSLKMSGMCSEIDSCPISSEKDSRIPGTLVNTALSLVAPSLKWACQSDFKWTIDSIERKICAYAVVGVRWSARPECLFLKGKPSVMSLSWGLMNRLDN